ncbi:MAG: hypothetical protein HOD00_06750 [Gemmatimonadales bacterium]|nr:hypothetical protein [Gemmatimonadales bacterium]
MAPEVAGPEALGTIIEKIHYGPSESALAQLVDGRMLAPDVAARMKSMVDQATKD